MTFLCVLKLVNCFESTSNLTILNVRIQCPNLHCHRQEMTITLHSDGDNISCTFSVDGSITSAFISPSNN